MARLLGVGAAHVVRRMTIATAFETGAFHDGSMAETVSGAAYQALRTAALIGTKCALLSLRGGDSAGFAVAEAIDDAGIEDLSVTFLTRPSPSRLLLVDAGPSFVGGLTDDALYARRFPSQVMRRAFRDELAKADAVLVDDVVGETALRRVVKLAARPVHAVAGSVDGMNIFSEHVGALASLTLPIGDAGDPIASAERLRKVGLRSGILVAGQSVLAFDGANTLLQTSAVDGELRAHVAEMAGAVIAARLAGQPFARAVRTGLATAFLMQKAAPVDPTRLAEVMAELPEPQVIGVR